ncbi:MAG: aminoacyl-tRNA hydrolase [Clostridia bacterium]|nr:aminoacyl-tRNA hydrolase [Clostridia bacterium]
MYIIVGLGNPGKKYENTRHNMGFITLDLLAEKFDIKVNKIKFKALVGEGFISGHKVLLVKPQTYMNLSGNSVREVINFYKEDIENLIVIYDDLDTPLGSIRVRKKGSAGTHNGMRSVIYDLQDDNFPRIRIGIGQERKGDLVDFVIGGFTKAEVPLLEDACTRAAAAAACIVEKGVEKAMNEYNIRPNKKEKKETRESNEISKEAVESTTAAEDGNEAPVIEKDAGESKKESEQI